MKLGNCALLLTMTAITACGTGTPVAPSKEKSFVLLINPSPSCRTVQSPIPLDAFELLVAGDLVGRGASTLRPLRLLTRDVIQVILFSSSPETSLLSPD